MRYGQLGSKGIFDSLDRSGALSHRMNHIGSVEEAIGNPPAIGRAAVRGRYVRELSGNGTRYQCDWNGIFDRKQRKVLDLEDPFETEPKWKPRGGLAAMSRRFMTEEAPF